MEDKEKLIRQIAAGIIMYFVIGVLLKIYAGSWFMILWLLGVLAIVLYILWPRIKKLRK